MPRRVLLTMRFLLCALAVAAPSLSHCARGQSTDGSILRQLSTLNGEMPNITPWESLTMPESIHDNRATLAQYQTPAPSSVYGQPPPALQWTDPYSMTPAPSEALEESGWYDVLPEGCWPWGPRTPAAHRHCELFWPLEGTSWLNRPYSAGWAVGCLWGDDPLDSLVDLEPGIYGIYRLGWDYDYYWGLEARLGQATPAVHDRVVGTEHTTADVTLFDVSLLWYPTGDSRLRPYFCFGLGFQHFNFRDHHFDVVNTSTFSMPFGLGVKFMWRPWIVLRFEATENWAVGNDQLDMMHNFAITGGVEIRFGGPRPSYWPWNPNRTIW